MIPDAFHVSFGSHLVSGLVHHTPWFWKAMSNFETWTLRDRLADVELTRPVYIAGVARAGSTIMLEILASHAEVATHQYRDFPFLTIPYWWRTTLDNAHTGPIEPEERAHGDRLLVTPESPEAMEEPLWMAFFDHLHDSARSNVLHRDTANEKFEAFYPAHIRKLLLVSGRSRYVGKGNYNVTRLAYLQKMFPDARFIVPIRNPRNHIASLRKQHRLFTESAADHPRSVKHLNRVGHFEFGANRRPINAGDTDVVRSIEQLWEAGDDVRGWARYWAHVYGFVAAVVRDEPVASAIHVVRYEDLCANTGPMLEEVFAHAGLTDGASAVIDRYRGELTRPTYYAADYSQEEERAIRDECSSVAEWFGYDLASTSGLGVAAADERTVSL